MNLSRGSWALAGVERRHERASDFAAEVAFCDRPNPVKEKAPFRFRAQADLDLRSVERVELRGREPDGCPDQLAAHIFETTQVFQVTATLRRIELERRTPPLVARIRVAEQAGS